MRLRNARKLHNGDQVTVKDTGQTVTVIKAYPCPTDPDHYHCVDVMLPAEGYTTLTHLEVR
jgi:hypothetical protein